jgi:twitching motility protein PilT
MNAMDAVFTMAEAGLSVYTSIHANSALETIERIVNMFPPSDYERIYNRLSWTLIGIINQRLFKKRGGGRVLVCEILTNTEAVKNMIRAGKIQGIKNLFDTTYTGEIVSYEKYIENLKTSGVL